MKLDWPLAHHCMTWNGWWKKHDQAFDLDQMLDEIQELGYEGVELPGDPKVLGPANQVRKKLDERGLSVPAIATSVTANPHPPNTEKYRQHMDFAAELGVEVMMVCGGFRGGPRRTTFDSDYQLFAENLGYARDYAAKHGQQLAYHPHLGCIVENNTEVGRLLQFISDLPLCVDTGHTRGAGSDPIELIRKYPEKIIHMHLKDWNPQDEVFTELGEGSADIDFRDIFAALGEIGYDGSLVVERDNSPIAPKESARISRDHLRALAPA